ncbi:hypothetical protein A2U01_0055210, partial [Trifolium medium]|nr:hypothetical protein [Trifolium medium]
MFTRTFWRPPWDLGKTIPRPQVFLYGGRSWEANEKEADVPNLTFSKPTYDLDSSIKKETRILSVFVFATLLLTRTAMPLFSHRPRTAAPPRTHETASQSAHYLLYRDSARSPDRVLFQISCV